MDTLKILVVDDESRMRKLVKDFLTKKNFQVLEAGNGEEAMDIFYEEKDIALIILDVMMPKMDGWEVCREIRKNSKVPIIMLTAKSDESDELTGFELGVDEYISKPFSPKILVARVNALLRRSGLTAGNEEKFVDTWYDSVKEADKIYVLDMPGYLYKSRIIIRSIKRKLGILKGKKETLKSVYNLLKWTETFQNKNLKEIRSILDRYDDKVIWLSRKKDVEKIIKAV